MSMRILYIAENLDRPEEHMIRQVHAAGHEVTVLLPKDVPAYDALEKGGIQALPLVLNGRMDLRAVHSITKTLNQENIELVHCLRNNRPLANTLLATHKRPTATVCYRGTTGNLNRWDPGARLTYLSSRVDRIVAVSEGVRQYLLTLEIPAQRIVTIHKGHDVAWYHTDTKPDLSEFGIPPDAFVVGCAANMRALKGVDVLVRSLDHLSTKRDVHLLLIGEVRDPALADLIQQPGYAKRVHALGFRQDASALSGACHAFCMPSLRREGLPRAVIEAMSQSVPPLVTAVGGMVELVEDGISGQVVPPGNPEALADAIATWVDDETGRLQCGRQAKQRIEQSFSLAQTVRKTLALYDDVLQG